MLSQVFTYDYIDNTTNFIFSVRFSHDFKQLLLSSNRTTKDYVDGVWSYVGTNILEWWSITKEATLTLSDQEHLLLWKEAIIIRPKLSKLLSDLT